MDETLRRVKNKYRLIQVPLLLLCLALLTITVKVTFNGLWRETFLFFALSAGGFILLLRRQTVYQREVDDIAALREGRLTSGAIEIIKHHRPTALEDFGIHED